MSNGTTKARLGLKTQQSDWGWFDVYDHADYPQDYDTWSEKDQRNYENGRLRAANVQLALGKLPAKQDSVLIAMAAKLVGDSIPPRKLMR
jgi:hypothetical protein